MTRVWSSGAELNSPAIEHTQTSGAAATIQGTTKRSGNYAYKILNPTSGTAAGWRHVPAASGTVYGRFYLYVATAPNASTAIYLQSSVTSFAGLDAAATSAHDLRFMLDTNGDLVVHDNVGSLGTITLNTGQWYRVEFRIVPVNAAGSDVIEIKLDGNTEISRSDLTLSAVLHHYWGANLLANDETCTSGEWYFDDLAINTTLGTAQNSYPGAGAIIHLKPNAAGDFAEGSAGGSAPAATGWESVDEIPPDDGVTFWTLADNSTGSTDADRLDVNCEAFSLAGTITLVQVGVRLKPATSAVCSYTLRVKSQASGTITEGTTTSITGTAWLTHDDDVPHSYTLTSYTDPQGGGAWTPALLNAMQIGIRAPDANPDVQVSALWALVEYVEPTFKPKTIFIT